MADGAACIGDATVIEPDVVASTGQSTPSTRFRLIDVTAEDGDICYNLYTHTVSAEASFEVCMAYAYFADHEHPDFTVANTVTHAARDVSQEECESHIWTPAVDIAIRTVTTTTTET